MTVTPRRGSKSGQRYHLIFDLVGNHPLSACRCVLNPNGICVLAGVLALPKIATLLTRTLDAVVLSRSLSQKFVTFMARLNEEDLNIMRELMEAGKVTPVIDRLTG